MRIIISIAILLVSGSSVAVQGTLQPKLGEVCYFKYAAKVDINNNILICEPVLNNNNNMKWIKLP